MFENIIVDYELRALVASSFVGVTCGILGCFVVLKRMALIGDAISHAVLPGVVIGFIFFGYNTLAIFIGAVVSGLFTSALITWIQRNSITKDDSSVGIVFTAMFAVGIVGISRLTKSQGVHLDMKDFLFGNVLGVSDSDLILTFFIGLYVIFCVVLFYKYLFITTFDPLISLTMGISVAVIHYFIMFLLSITIVASLQSVGVILVVAMLIVPASAAYLLSHQLITMLFLSALIGFVSSFSGYYLAVYYEITPGPCMTLVAVFFFLCAFLFSPSRGYIVLLFIRLKRKYLMDQQDILKSIDKLVLLNDVSFDTLCFSLSHISNYFIWLHLKHLEFIRYIEFNGDMIALTVVGKNEADSLVRAHRLWESYLVNRMNVPLIHIHQSAEEMEHLLPKDFVDKVDKDLGFPVQDPHGSPIPVIKKKFLKLSDLVVGQAAVVSIDQGLAIKDLWRLGIFPNSEFVVTDISKDFISILINNVKFAIERNVSERIRIKL